jgi:hypothetical protein
MYVVLSYAKSSNQPAGAANVEAPMALVVQIPAVPALQAPTVAAIAVYGRVMAPMPAGAVGVERPGALTNRRNAGMQGEE